MITPPRRVLAALPWAGLFVFTFWPTFVWMAERFDAHDSFYSHGWLIPIAGAWLIWRRRSRIHAAAWRGSYAGLWLLIPALLLHVAAVWWRVHAASGLAMLAAIWGLVWTVWGRAALRALRFPLAFLVFMVPLPGILLIAASFHMKMAAAALATHALQLMGVEAAQAGSTILAPGVSVIVDDTCSGLRSLISLLALSAFWTDLLPATARPWQKWALVAASIPIALIANMARILTLVMVAVIYGARAAQGFLHYGSGLVVFGVALAVLAWLSRVLVPVREAR